MGSSKRSRIPPAAGSSPCRGIPSAPPIRTCRPRARASSARSLTRRPASPPGHGDRGLALVRDRRETDGLVDLIEALRRGCAGRWPAPRVGVAGEAHAALRLKAASVGFAVELLPDPRRPDGISAFAHRGREFRRGTDPNVVLRDEALEELARLVAAHGSDVLIVHLSGGSTSLVPATPAP